MLLKRLKLILEMVQTRKAEVTQITVIVILIVILILLALSFFFLKAKDFKEVLGM